MLAWSRWLLLFGIAGQPLFGQQVLIRNASPALITQTAAQYLQPDGFVLVRSDSLGAEFGLDRGKIPQHGMFHSGRVRNNLFRVIMEVHLSFKPQKDGSVVSVYEDAVVLDDDSAFVQRRRVTTRSELDNLRAFLTDLQNQVQARVGQSDSTKP